MWVPKRRGAAVPVGILLGGGEAVVAPLGGPTRVWKGEDV